MENEEVKKEIVPIKEILFKDYLPYWPYFVLVGMLALLGAFLNLRYQTPVYQVNAMMMIKPEKEGINSMMEIVGGRTRWRWIFEQPQRQIVCAEKR
jgi:hypothetical protein